MFIDILDATSDPLCERLRDASFDYAYQMEQEVADAFERWPTATRVCIYAGPNPPRGQKSHDARVSAEWRREPSGVVRVR